MAGPRLNQDLVGAGLIGAGPFDEAKSLKPVNQSRYTVVLSDGERITLKADSALIDFDKGTLSFHAQEGEVRGVFVHWIGYFEE